jgi:hypothetical protein
VIDLDIWRAARQLMKLRDDPEFYAAQPADELLAAGDAEGCRVWTRIGMAIRNLSEPKPVSPACRDHKWVCENHPDKPWHGANHHTEACDCGAGMPCACNTSNPPKMPDGRRTLFDRKGWRH